MQNFKPRGNSRDNRVRHQFFPKPEGEMVKLDIHHRDGGLNYFSYKQEERGVEISVTAVKIENRGGFTSEQSTPMADTNIRFLIAPMARFNAKKLAKIAEVFDPVAPEISSRWLEDRAGAQALLLETAERAAAAIA